MRTRTSTRTTGSNRTRRILAGGTAVLVLVGAGLALATPASAAEGDAGAIGAGATLNIEIGDVSESWNEAVGEIAVVSGEQDADAQTDVTLIDAFIASLTLGSSETAAESTPTVAHAASQVAGTSFDLFGLNVVSIAQSAAAVSCVPAQEPQAEIVTEGLSILGVPVVLDDDGAVETTSLPAEVALSDDPSDLVDLSGIDITAEISRVRETSSTGAIAISLVLTVELDGTSDAGDFDSEIVGTLTLAGAICEAPPLAPLALSAVSPLSGPFEGGQTVTLTGTGFTPGVTVAFGGVPATGLVVDPAGTSLTVVSPAATAAGPTTVTVSRPDGATASLAYTYLAAVPVPTPSGTPVPAAIAVLPATGSEVGATPLLGAGVMLLGLAMLGAQSLVRRRRHA